MVLYKSEKMTPRRRHIQVLFFLLCYDSIEANMSEQQLQAAARLVRNVCQPKNKASSEQLDGMKVGKYWDELDRSSMCYLHCCLNMQRLIAKDNTLDTAAAATQIAKQLPIARQKDTEEILRMCKNSAKTLDDKCVAGYEIARCFYFTNPAAYFLP